MISYTPGRNLLTNNPAEWGNYSGVNYAGGSNRIAPGVHKTTIPVCPQAEMSFHVKNDTGIGEDFYVVIYQLDSNLSLINNSSFRSLPYTFTTLEDTAFIRLALRDSTNDTMHMGEYLAALGNTLGFMLQYGSPTEFCPAVEDAGFNLFGGGWPRTVLARSAINLSWERDIVSVTWYYKLQASTASAPEKPTADTPAGWVTSEPSYTEGSTNSLYIVQKTSFSDGSFEYSDVSLSSSYEAAKTAYNKSIQAKTVADTALAQSIEYVVGTQNAATNLWTGVTQDNVLAIGKTIAYKLPFAGNSSAAKLTLTLADGTQTGQVPVRLNDNTNVTTHYPANTIIQMTYDGTAWKICNYNTNSNDVDRSLYGVAFAADAAIAAKKIAVLGTNDKLHVLNNAPFMIGCPPLYVATAYTTANASSGATRTSNYCYWGTAFDLTATHAVENAAAGKPVYIVGTLENGIFTPSSTVLTCTEPTTEDGLFYMRLGMMSTVTTAVLENEHPVYLYYDGLFMTYEEAQAARAAKEATEYIFDTRDTNEQINGAMVHPKNDLTSGWKIADALELLKSGISYIKLWIENNIAKIRIGREDQGNVLIDNDSVDIRSGTNVLASFGSTTQVGKSNGKNVLIGSDGVKVRNGTTNQAVFGTDTVIGPESGTHIVIDSQSGDISILKGNRTIATIRYNETSSGTPGEILSDYVQAKILNTEELRAYKSGVGVVSAACEDGDEVQLRTHSTRAGIYNNSASSWLIYSDEDGDTVLPEVANNIVVDKTKKTMTAGAAFMEVRSCDGSGSGDAAGDISLYASPTGKTGLYKRATQTWLINDCLYGTEVPDLFFLSDVGTVASTFSGANGKYCNLYKVGKIVFACIGIHYLNASSQIATNTTIFTIPADYRPYTEVTLAAQMGLVASSSALNKSAVGTVKVSAAGAVTQNYSANVYSIYCFGMWETA